MKVFIKDFFSKYDQIRSFLRICSHLLKKYLMVNFVCAASVAQRAFPKNFAKTKSLSVFISLRLDSFAKLGGIFLDRDTNLKIVFLTSNLRFSPVFLVNCNYVVMFLIVQNIVTITSDACSTCSNAVTS